jgi:hypothetical protein
MRLLRGVAGRVLPCGCLVGIYETYDGTVVATIDACGSSCRETGHQLHTRMPVPPASPAGESQQQAGPTRTSGSDA